MKSITLKQINHIKELSALNKAWDALVALQKMPSFCINFDWCYLWCQLYLDAADQLIIHSYYDENKLIALFPVYLKKVHFGYQLRFIGTGEDESIEVCSEFQDFIIDPDYQSCALEQFTNDLKQVKHINSIVLENTLQDSLVAQWFHQYLTTSHMKKSDETSVRFLLPILTELNEQIKAFPNKTIQRHANKYLAVENCQIEHATCLATLKTIFDDLISLHNMAWEAREKQGVFTKATFVDFHRKLAANLLEKNKLVLFRLLCEKKVLAVFYGFLEKNVLFYYQSGIVRESSLPSAGTAMHLAALDLAQQRNLEHYDLMQGKLNSYKNKYTNVQYPVFTLSANNVLFLVGNFLTKLMKKINVVK